MSLCQSESHMTGFSLPPLSASSKITHPQKGYPRSFDFRFLIHEPSGALLLVPEDDTGLLDAVRNAKHCEPEDHLETASALLIEALIAAQVLHNDYSVCGLSDKDQTLVETICRRLNSTSPGLILLSGSHSLEVQDIVCHSPSEINCGPQSILVVRHLLEHARNLDSFLHGLWNIIGEDSICLIEVPDSIDLLTFGDITQLWEEHTAYFTSASFQRALRNGGFHILAQRELISEGEKLGLAVVRRSNPLFHQPVEQVHDPSACDFLARLPTQLHQIKSTLATLASERSIHLFGANHVAGIFLDLIDKEAMHVHGVIDDDPAKVGNCLGLLCTPIVSLDSVDAGHPVHMLVAVNQGRAANLYDRLCTLFPESNGHCVESLVTFSQKLWQAH